MNISISKLQKEKIESYIKHGEISYISANIKIDNKDYREISFFKSTFGIRNNKTEGYVYTDDTGNVVKDRKLKEDIAELAYYNQFYFDTDSKISFSRALTKNKDMKKNILNFKKSVRGLESLNLNSTNETNIIKSILENVPKSKLKNNEIIKVLINEVAKYKESGVSFDLAAKETFQVVYDKLLMVNYQMIKSIAEGEIYYDGYKSCAKKIIRQFMIRYNRRVNDALNKLIYELSYFQVMLKTYEEILDLSFDQYLQYVKKVDKFNMQKRKLLIRV